MQSTIKALLVLVVILTLSSISFPTVSVLKTTNASKQTDEYSDHNELTETEDYFATNGFGKPVSTLQHPAGEFYNGITYLAYQGPHEDPYVCSYNHTTREWKGPVHAGISALGKTPESSDPEEIDNHGRPSMIIDREGYIHLFFGGHGGNPEFGSNPLGHHGKGRQSHAVSRKPGDISSWEILENISPFGTYSQLIKMANGDIFLFYRHGSHRSDWVYQKSVDNGRRFSSPVSILRHKPQEGNPSVYDSWYAWFQEGPDNTIYATFNYHHCANPGHSSLRLNAYVMKMNVDDDHWENVNGEKLPMPLTKESADNMAIIPQSKGEKTRLGTIKLDAGGNPHVYFRQSGKFFYYRWNGEAWMDVQIPDLHVKFSDADFLVEGSETTRVISSQQRDKLNEICLWQTKNGGETWEMSKSLMATNDAKYSMSAIIRNAHPDARVIIAEIPTNPSSVMSKLYLLGDAGLVQRAFPGADEK